MKIALYAAAPPTAAQRDGLARLARHLPITDLLCLTPAPDVLAWAQAAGIAVRLPSEDWPALVQALIAWGDESAAAVRRALKARLFVYDWRRGLNLSPRLLNVCPHCGAQNDGNSSPKLQDGDALDPLPEIGDFTICLYCQGVSRYGLGLALRKATDAEVDEIMPTPTGDTLLTALRLGSRFRAACPDKVRTPR